MLVIYSSVHMLFRFTSGWVEHMPKQSEKTIDQTVGLLLECGFFYLMKHELSTNDVLGVMHVKVLQRLCL